MIDYPNFSETETTAGKRIVYVRPIPTSQLPDEIQAEVKANLGRETVYAIHAASGEVLALVPDRHQAFIVARQNEFAPVSVH